MALEDEDLTMTYIVITICAFITILACGTAACILCREPTTKVIRIDQQPGRPMV